jgi:hypothetical protein
LIQSLFNLSPLSLGHGGVSLYFDLTIPLQLLIPKSTSLLASLNITILACIPTWFSSSSSSRFNSFILPTMAYIRATGHSVLLMMQIAEGGHARVHANVLHAHFEIHLTSIYIEEEVLSESGKVDRTIL